MSAPVGSCIVVPCSFTPPTANEAVEVNWYQYVSSGYPLVYSESKPGDVIDKFSDSTELIGRAEKGNCSLKINPTREAHNAEKIYVWIKPNQLDGKLYDQTVKLEVTENATQPEIRVLSSDLTEGDVVRLSCDVIHTCPPSPPSVSFRNHTGALRWSHNEEEEGRWRISVETSWKVNSVDHGRGVVCDVTHPGGRTASREIVLRVTYPPKSVSVHGSSNALPPGGSVSLSCSSQANPPATSFQWYFMDQGQPKLLEVSSKNIRVMQLRNRDQKLYRCKASNSVGSGSSPDFEVIKEYQPSISKASGCSFYAGAVSCWCEATARPSASLQWRVDGVTQEASPARPSTTSVHTVRGEWAGKAATEQVSVTCVSSNRHGQKERLLRVYVKAPLSNVMVTQHPSRPREGEGVTLSCTGQGYPPASGYRWYLGRDGQEIGLEEESSELSVRPVARDSGPYRCTARNQMGESSSPVTSVNVEYAPLILRNSSCTLGNGQWRCECIVDSSPPAKVTWSSVGSSTNESGNTLSTLSGRVLRSVLTGPMGDGGHRFYCNATNEHGDAFYLLLITVEHFGKWGIVLGAIGGAVLICLLLGAFLYCKRTKRRPKHADLSLKEVKCAGEEEVKIDSLYSNIRACPPAHALPESMYEVEDAPRYQEMKRQPSYDDDVYQNY
ncbi:sialic acid-binding Ig-like lectin 5 isoform X2 [Anguilla anguilla]|nr:sialic acid-binding Ig-like lectin 5 isoform X2 [Anguilla anguilla]